MKRFGVGWHNAVEQNFELALRDDKTFGTTRKTILMALELEYEKRFRWKYDIETIRGEIQENPGVYILVYVTASSIILYF